MHTNSYFDNLLFVFIVSIAVSSSCLGQTEIDNLETVDSLAVQAVKSATKISYNGEGGTCFFVKRESDSVSQVFLITAAHTLAVANPPKTGATLVVRKNGRRLDSEFKVRSENGEALWKKHPKFDVAAMPIKISDSSDLFVFPMSQIASEKQFETLAINVGQECMVPCFPVKLESSRLGFPVLRRGAIASYPLVPVKEFPTFLIDFSAFGGDSGAPVIANVSENSSPPTTIVVGMVFAKQRQSDTTKTPYEERTVHTPMGLGIAVGSPIIRETIALFD